MIATEKQCLAAHRDDHILIWLTAEEAIKQLSRQSQAWAV